MDEKLESDLGLDQQFPDVFKPAPEVIALRAQTFAGVDPFPGVPPALLNSADVLDYVAATGMVYPFRLDLSDTSATMKPAAYGVPLLGMYVYWERILDGGSEVTYTKRVGELAEGDELALRPNTITFVQLEPFFRLPRYIAARFNLAIQHIYQGILVGTGPLVDPGFEGRLSMPLHNLTSNEYTLIAGQPLVWMEFTKLGASTDDPGWRNAQPHEEPKRRGFYVEFPPRKKQLGLEDYLRKAHPGPIVSSIPAALGRAQEAAETARDEAKTSRRWIQTISFVGALVIALTVAAILVPTWSLIDDAKSRQDDTRDRVQQLEHQVADQRARDAAAIASLRTQLARLRHK